MSLQDAKLILTPNGYKAGKLYSVKPTDGTGDATVVRNVTKTRVNSSGLIESMAANVLAPDYLNGVCPALNVEGQATNLNGTSSNYSAWTFKDLATIVSSTEPSLMAGKPATLIKANADIGGSFFKIINISTSPLTYTSSVFFKQASSNIFRFDVRYSGGTITTNNALTYNFTTGNIDVLASSGLISANVINYINGWKRFIVVTENNNSGNNQIQNYIYPDFENGNNSSLVWNNDILQSSTSSSTIFTTTGPVTRSADTVTVPIPAGTTEIIEKHEDGTTNTITTIPASPYTVPVGRYEYILMR